ncbi:MAG TPA: APC family permease [Terriglobia bacterium]|nr:APC family permease [Terriglobia bacterium]
MENSAGVAVIPRLRRVLTLWDLIIYGIIAVTPSAPVTVFGLAVARSRGHAVDTILIAMVAMLLTAFSYGRMAALYPSAGSAYTYVGRGINPHLGFLAGWAMLLDYILIPLFCTMFGTLTLHRLVPEVPFPILAAVFVGFMTFLNLRGVRATARANEVLLSVMLVVLFTFIVLAIRYLFHATGWRGIFSTMPFYNPETFDFRAIQSATAFAALTYTGFDAVTTLAEDVKNPKRSVLVATVLVCLFTGLFGGLLVYLGQLVWPDYQSYTNIETAFMDMSQRVGGPLLFQGMSLILVIAMLGSGLAGQVGAGRLLFGMGRDSVLPKRPFAYLDPKRNNPSFNIWMIGIIAYFGSVSLSYELAGELLNFGAFLSFMGVNLAAVYQLYFVGEPRDQRRLLKDAILPGLGFLFCSWIWWNLAMPAKIVGGFWILGGIIFAAVKTKGFRRAPVMVDFSDA